MLGVILTLVIGGQQYDVHSNPTRPDYPGWVSNRGTVLNNPIDILYMYHTSILCPS